jgi:hypothetical protein
MTIRKQPRTLSTQLLYYPNNSWEKVRTRGLGLVKYRNDRVFEQIVSIGSLYADARRWERTLRFDAVRLKGTGSRGAVHKRTLDPVSSPVRSYRAGEVLCNHHATGISILGSLSSNPRRSDST